MPARLDLPLAHRLASAFPNGSEWQRIDARAFVADRGTRLSSDWSPADHLAGVGGVYAVLLPASWFSRTITLPLHAPHNHHEDCIPFEFTLPVLADGCGVIYVGRTDLKRRIRLHLSNGERKDGGQVKFGLFDCNLHTDLLSALRALREHGRFVYTVLPGPEHCANRDVLEMALCARFGPPFNIKSE